MAAASELLSNVKDATTCSICLGCYSDPRILPCGHTFCHGCLRQNFGSKPPGSVVPCPMCRKNFMISAGGLSDLSRNFNLIDLMKCNQRHDSHLGEDSGNVAAAVPGVVAGQIDGGLPEQRERDIDADDTCTEGFERLRSYVKECKEKIKTFGLNDFRQFLITKLEEWKTLPLDIAVIGNSGVGKSSFINAIRDMTAEADGAADVGVNECTVNIRAYPHPNNKLLKFWDLPGVGSRSFPINQYTESVKIDRYDFFLLMTADRFRENDIWLCQEILKSGKQFYVVRTKIKHDLKSDKKAHPTKHNEEEVLGEIRQNIIDNLRPEVAKVFLIENYEKKKFDFAKLEESLIQDFPELKRQTFILSLYPFSEKKVRIKVKELRTSLLTRVVASDLAAAVHVPGFPVDLDVNFIIEQSNDLFKQLALDDESLQKHAELTKTSPETLQQIVKKTFPPEFFSSERIKAYVQELRINPTPTQHFIHIICSLPIVRSLWSNYTASVWYTTEILKSIINKMEEVALTVVH